MHNFRYFLIAFLLLAYGNSFSQTKSDAVDDILDTVLDHVNHDHHYSDDYHIWEQYLKQPHPKVGVISSYFQLATPEFGYPLNC